MYSLPPEVPPEHLIYPVFVHEGTGNQPISSLPGCTRWSVKGLVEEAKLDTRGDESGYQLTTWGGTVGMDVDLSDCLLYTSPSTRHAPSASIKRRRILLRALVRCLMSEKSGRRGIGPFL